MTALLGIASGGALVTAWALRYRRAGRELDRIHRELRVVIEHGLSEGAGDEAFEPQAAAA